MRDLNDQKDIARWVRTWERAGKALEQARRSELRAYDYRRNLPVIDEMLRWACENAGLRTTTGFVEQQRWFMKLRQRRKHAIRGRLAEGD